MVFIVFGAVLFYLATELVALAGWRLTTGKWFTWADAAQRRTNAVAPDFANPQLPPPTRDVLMQRLVFLGCAPHPYLGYVLDADAPQGPDALPVSRWGFLDTGTPIHRRDAGTFLVAITGGSVSVQLCHYARDVLEQELGRIAAARGRRVVLVPLGLGGYKQPQQVISLEYLLMLGGEFDLVINPDGFNEVALVSENLVNGSPAFFPRSWARLHDSQPSRAQQIRIGRQFYLRQQRADMAVGAQVLRWSPLAQLVWLVRDRRSGRQIADLTEEIEHAAGTPSYGVTGPGTLGCDELAAVAQAVDVWAS